MAERELVVIMGALSRTRKAKTSQLQDAIAKRWRMDGLLEPLADPASVEPRDVIPLLDGWIRRLERESGPHKVQTR